MGVVKNITSEITRIIGFCKEELKGTNISAIMPKIFGDLHNFCIIRYMDKGSLAGINDK